MNAAGEAYPPPRVATGTLNSMAASGAAPVTMQNRTDGRPSTPPASSPGGPPVGTAPAVGSSALRSSHLHDWRRPGRHDVTGAYRQPEDSSAGSRQPFGCNLRTEGDNDIRPFGQVVTRSALWRPDFDDFGLDG